MYHGRSQWANRTAPRVYEAFEQVLGTARICCSSDRANITPPSRNPAESIGPNSLHWDAAPLYAYNRTAHGSHIEVST
mgnify:CR=1 FL=1